MLAQAAEIAKKIDAFLIEREQSVLSKLIALGGSLEQESFEVQVKVKITEARPHRPGGDAERDRDLYEAALSTSMMSYFFFDDPVAGTSALPRR